MSLATRLTALAQAVGADIKALNGKVLASDAVLLDTWHTVGAAGEPPFLNGWVNYNAPLYGALQYRKDPFGRVHLRGSVKNGTLGTGVFRLPFGYWPAAGTIATFMSYTSATTFATYQIDSSGTVSCFYRNDVCDMSVIEFDTDLVTTMPTGPQGPVGAAGVAGPTGGNATVPMDPWHTVGGATEPPFANVGFSNIVGNQAAQFRKDPLGKVLLRGYINTPAAGGSAFTLPNGYKPPGTVRFSANGQNAANAQIAVLLYILSDGTVNVHSTNAPVAVDLSTAEFDTDTVTQMPTGPVGPQGPQGATGGNATVPMDTWHTVGAGGGEPAFLGTPAWHATAGYSVRFRKDPLGKVKLAGGLTPGSSASGGQAFQLPAGYRPVGNERGFVCQSNSGSVFVYVDVNGYVNVTSQTMTYVYLDPIEFDTELVTAMPTGPQGPKGDTGGPMVVGGIVADTGGISRGTGFTCVRNSVGDYTITFNPAFPVGHEPVVTFSLAHGSAFQVTFKLKNGQMPSINGFTVVGFNPSGGANADGSFSFHAIQT